MLGRREVGVMLLKDLVELVQQLSRATEKIGVLNVLSLPLRGQPESEACQERTNAQSSELQPEGLIVRWERWRKREGASRAAQE